MGRIVLPLYTPRYVPNGHEVAVIRTSRGTIRVRLAGKDAPATAGNFIELAAREFYDGLKFHACKPGSVVVGGCPTTRALGPAQVEAAARGAVRGIRPGTGDARYVIVDEWKANPRNRHLRGSLCLAHKSAPNSGSCQFYFSLAEQPQLDDKFTVFGQVVEGFDVLDALGVGDVIESVRIEGADEEALARAVSFETPRPRSAKEALEEIERARAERAAATKGDAAGASADAPFGG
ncbi:peptidylprolyl isomerase [Gordonibacter sp. An230]|uniref:peptidylprolyl isomerase n=1 Tax=Gordonibacter sp. An230 TaxID=1965592 RepID=UPI000B3910BD|nr:peptidylprolyl isomerase [Gordonibacter sp. An230]OUO92137.1 peptidylprolyl isomerase [Gordonibacter sp. An230]